MVELQPLFENFLTSEQLQTLLNRRVSFELTKPLCRSCLRFACWLLNSVATGLTVLHRTRVVQVWVSVDRSGHERTRVKTNIKDGWNKADIRPKTSSRGSYWITDKALQENNRPHRKTGRPHWHFFHSAEVGRCVRVLHVCSSDVCRVVSGQVRWSWGLEPMATTGIRCSSRTSYRVRESTWHGSWKID